MFAMYLIWPEQNYICYNRFSSVINLIRLCALEHHNVDTIAVKACYDVV